MHAFSYTGSTARIIGAADPLQGLGKVRLLEITGKREMRKILSSFIAAFAAMLFLVLSACASQKEPADPVKEQAQITESRNKERALIQSTVADQQRAGRVIELLADRDRLIADHAQEVNAYRERMVALNADYTAQRDSFDALIASYNRQRANAQRDLFALIEAMKQETTVEEWKVISAYQLKALDPRKLIYSQVSGGA